jgi:hypothetical protein
VGLDSQPHGQAVPFGQFRVLVVPDEDA